MANPLGDLLEWLFAAKITTSDAFASAKALIEANVTRETIEQASNRAGRRLPLALASPNRPLEPPWPFGCAAAAGAAQGPHASRRAPQACCCTQERPSSEEERRRVALRAGAAQRGAKTSEEECGALEQDEPEQAAAAHPTERLATGTGTTGEPCWGVGWSRWSQRHPRPGGGCDGCCVGAAAHRAAGVRGQGVVARRRCECEQLLLLRTGTILSAAPW